MKHLFLILLFFGCIGLAAQETSVEKSIWNVQTGLFGIWANNESRLSRSVALRTEAGLDAGLFMGGIYDRVGFVLVPVVTLEPRWYYNLEKRVEKSKNITGNSGNFLSLKTSYHPNWFVISSRDDLEVVSQISVIPTWGIRRTIGPHFNYEAGFGLGYRYIFAKAAGFDEDDSEVAVNVHLRIGYQF